MRPEKVWRPIITVDIDKHYTHETTLGVDGQSVNRKDCFKLYVLASNFTSNRRYR